MTDKIVLTRREYELYDRMMEFAVPTNDFYDEVEGFEGVTREEWEESFKTMFDKVMRPERVECESQSVEDTENTIPTDTTFDFYDGKGRVPAHHHPNGGGVVANTANVADTVYVGPDAKVYGYAQVTDNVTVRGCARICGNARVSDHVIVEDYAVVSGEAKIKGFRIVRDCEVYT